MRPLFSRFIAFTAFILFFSLAISAQNTNALWEVAWDVPLFRNSTGGVQSVSRDESGWIRKVTGSYGDAHKGQRVHKIHQIREHRMLVTLDDKRKGWIDLPFLWPPANAQAYLLQDIKFHHLKAEPNVNSHQAVDIDPKRSNKRFHRNTRVTLSRWYTDKDQYDNFKTAYPSNTWAYITIDEEAKGWIPLKYIRLHGQMHDDAINLVWKPIRWISDLLGDGFWAGLIVFLLYTVPILLTFFAVRYLSQKLKFIPNFILFTLITLVTVVVYFSGFVSVFDASSFNQNSGGLFFLFVLLTGGGSIGFLVAIFQHIRETRCPSCKEWQGEAYNREHLGTTTTTTTTTTTYNDGSRVVKSDKDIREDWKDYCMCENCGHKWVLYRVIKR